MPGEGEEEALHEQPAGGAQQCRACQRDRSGDHASVAPCDNGPGPACLLQFDMRSGPATAKPATGLSAKVKRARRHDL